MAALAYFYHLSEANTRPATAASMPQRIRSLTWVVVVSPTGLRRGVTFEGFEKEKEDSCQQHSSDDPREIRFLFRS